MGYVSGTRTLQSNSAEDLYGLIAAQLTAHANYTFIEDVSLATYKYSVWRCGSLNSTGANYYIFFNRTTAASTTLSVGIAEDYDSGTHQFTRGAPTPSSSAKTAAGDQSIVGSTTTALYNVATGGVNMLMNSLVADPSSFDYWIAVNNDGFWCSIRVGINTPQAVWVGTFDSLVDNAATADPKPIYVAGNNSNSSSSASVATPRHPLVTGSLAYLWGMTEPFAGATYAWPQAAIQGSVGSTTGDLFQSTKAVGARIMIRTWAQQRSASITTTGGNRGLYRHMLFFNNAAGVTVGDTITIGSTTWVFTGRGNVYYEASAA